MLPTLKQRILISAVVLAAGLVWLLAASGLATPDASSGFSLISTERGFVLAVLVVLLTGLPAVGLGLFTAGTGHPLSGVFVVSAALVFLAVAGGAIDGLLWRIEVPSAYLWLTFEMLLWAALLVGVVALVQRYRLRVRRAAGVFRTDEHWGEGIDLGVPDSQGWLAGLIAAGVGALLANLLIQSTDVGQVIGGLLVAFTLAAMLAQMVLPTTKPAAIVLCPIVVAVLGYLQTWFGYADGDALKAAWYAEDLSGLAMALPIHYASAAVAGCVLGVGAAQSLDRAREQAAQKA